MAAPDLPLVISGRRTMRILSALAASNARLHSDRATSTFRVADGALRLISAMPLPADSATPGRPEAPVGFECAGGRVRAVFHSVYLTEDRVQIPTELRCSTERAADRISPGYAFSIAASLEHEGRVATAEVVDASWFGVRLVGEGLEAMVAAPAPTVQLTFVHDQERHELRTPAKVVRSTRRPDGRTEVALRLDQPTGLDTRPLPDEWEAWFLLLEAKLFPNSARDRVSEAVAVLRAQYARIPGRGQELFEAQAPAFEPIGMDLAGSPLAGHVIVHTGAPCSSAARRPLATMSFLHLYSRTWVGHQIGKVPDTRGLDKARVKQVDLELYEHAFGLIGRDPQAEWVSGACRLTGFLKPHWDLLHELGPGKASCIPMRLVEIHTRPPTPRGKASASLVATDEVAADAPVVRDVCRRLPRPYAESLDLVEGRADLAAARAWLGLHHKPHLADAVTVSRRFFLIRRGLTHVALGVVDVTAGVTSVQSIFDSVRVFGLGEARDAVLFGAAAQAIIEEARKIFLEHGKLVFSYYLEGYGASHLPEYLGRFDTSDSEEGFYWAVPAKAIPQLLLRIWEKTVHG